MSEENGWVKPSERIRRIAENINYAPDHRTVLEAIVMYLDEQHAQVSPSRPSRINEPANTRGGDTGCDGT